MCPRNYQPFQNELTVIRGKLTRQGYPVRQILPGALGLIQPTNDIRSIVLPKRDRCCRLCVSCDMRPGRRHLELQSNRVTCLITSESCRRKVRPPTPGGLPHPTRTGRRRGGLWNSMGPVLRSSTTIYCSEVPVWVGRGSRCKFPGLKRTTSYTTNGISQDVAWRFLRLCEGPACIARLAAYCVATCGYILAIPITESAYNMNLGLFEYPLIVPHHGVSSMASKRRWFAKYASRPTFMIFECCR